MSTSISSPLVFIIVLNWNGKDDTLECLVSLQKLEYSNFKILVVDNGSYDGLEDAVRSSFPSVNFIQTGKNLGYAGGNNVGIRFALSQGADYIWLLNNDTTVDAKALTALVETAQSDPKIAFVGSKIYFYDRPTTIWFAGGEIDLSKGGLTNHRGFNQEDNGQFDAVSDVGYVTGCSLLAGRVVISAIGLIPEKYFLYFEETDWNLKAQNKGFRTVIAPESRVWHKYAFNKGRSKRLIYYSFRNRIHLVKKYSPKNLFDAVKVNLGYLDRYRTMFPEQAREFFVVALLAHLDALLCCSGPTKWKNIK